MTSGGNREGKACLRSKKIKKYMGHRRTVSTGRGSRLRRSGSAFLNAARGVLSAWGGALRVKEGCSPDTRRRRRRRACVKEGCGQGRRPHRRRCALTTRLPFLRPVAADQFCCFLSCQSAQRVGRRPARPGRATLSGSRQPSQAGVGGWGGGTAAGRRACPTRLPIVRPRAGGPRARSENGQFGGAKLDRPPPPAAAAGEV
jgi:hypothetical protein